MAEHHRPHVFQRPHPSHLRVLREQVAARGMRSVERQLGLAAGGLRRALSGGGVWPSTIAKIASLSTQSAPPPPSPQPARDLTKAAQSVKDMGAAISLVLEVLAGVPADNRARVLDAARAAL